MEEGRVGGGALVNDLVRIICDLEGFTLPKWGEKAHFSLFFMVSIGHLWFRADGCWYPVISYRLRRRHSYL